ncbi:MAG: hypothetical protein IKL88_00800 [Erysipelotrichales bacterium]|nr:hypothetical protein [Erysipelotrichales bacterium]
MEAKTRVKKYEELRETLLKENLENQEAPKLSRFAKRLSNIDSEYFQPIVESYERDAKKEIVIPQRVMKEEVEVEQDEYFNEQEILSRALRVTSQNQDSSDDELLNQFLKEIRNYNKKQGVRSVDDTRMEILKQVRVESEEVKEAPVKEKKVQPSNPVRESIAKQVRDMLKTQENEPVEPSKVLIDLNEKDEETDKEDKYLLVLQEERVNRAKILEETQQLRLKLNEHEDELEDIGSGIDYTRKLLNVLLLLLMITVLIAGGILAYLVMKG